MAAPVRVNVLAVQADIGLLLKADGDTRHIFPYSKRLSTQINEVRCIQMVTQILAQTPKIIVVDKRGVLSRSTRPLTHSAMG